MYRVVSPCVLTSIQNGTTFEALFKTFVWITIV